MNTKLNRKQLPLSAAALAFLPTLTFLPTLAFAHAGVGHSASFWHGIAHPFSGADHLLAMLAVGLWAVQMGSRALWVLPCAFVALMLAGGVLGIANIPLPYVEEGILLSVLILGALIAGAFRFSLAAKFAVEYFARQVRGFISAYAAKSGGIDGLVFTGGIGEHSAQVRALICEQFEFLGFYLNKKANQSHLTVLNTPSSKPITIIPADEEAEIARLVTDISRN